MRSITILFALLLVLGLAMLVTFAARTDRTTVAEAPAHPAVNWLCANAFRDALDGETTPSNASRLDRAVRSCSSVEDWLLAATTHPEALGDADAATFLETRCRSDRGLRRYAACDSLDIEPSAPEVGRLQVRSDRSAGSGVPEGIGMEIILDTSGSMLRKVAGVRQIDIAKDSLSLLMNDALAPGFPLALRSFGGDGGGRRAACQSILTAGLTPLDPETMLAVVASVDAGKRTKSPIADSIAAAANDLRSASHSRIVVLVTDGDENCGGDPIREIETLREAGVPLTLNVVGVAVEDDALRDTMLDWAQAGSGRYFDAADADELAAAITEAATPIIDTPVLVTGPGGVLIDDGAVDGEAIKLDAGTYDVSVQTDPPVLFEAVEVVGGEHVELFLS